MQHPRFEALRKASSWRSAGLWARERGRTCASQRRRKISEVHRGAIVPHFVVSEWGLDLRCHTMAVRDTTPGAAAM
jgi:hypothetical protein